LFQSTRPRGARQLIILQPHELERVSIHAPARGAPAHTTRSTSRSGSFNPRARAGRAFFQRL